MSVRSIGLMAMVVAFAGGCGIDFKIGDGTGTRPAPSRFELETASAESVIRLGTDVDRLVAFSRGIDGLIPDFEEFMAEAGLGGSGESLQKPSLAPTSIFDECPGEDVDPWVLPDDNICIFTEAKSNPEPGVDNSIESAGIYFPDGLSTAESDLIGVFYQGTKWYSDGSTGFVKAIDLEAPTGTSETNLNVHNIEYTELRQYPEGSDIVAEQGWVGINFNGLPDDSAAADRAAVNDGTDVGLYAIFWQSFADGSEIELQYWPSEPIEGDEDPAAGTVTYTARYSDGPLLESIETFRWDTVAAVASGSSVLTYSDGSTESESFRMTATVVEVATSGRKGEVETLSLDLAAGTYERLVVYPEGHELARLEESGTFSESGLGRISVTLMQTTTHADGGSESLDATIVATGDKRLEVSYSEVDVDGGVETGDFVLIDGITSDSLSATVVAADGVIIEVEAVLFRDGSATLEMVVNDPTTEPDPDWTARLRVAPDGSISGTVTQDGVTEPIDLDAGEVAAVDS